MVPEARHPGPEDIRNLIEFLSERRVVALTGAGCSTESGIPDYRGEGTRRRAKAPVQYRQFLGSAHARQRYWARSVVGWPQFSSASPNAGHRALAALERAGFVSGVVTQNVDRLHHAAGGRHIVELHGALAEVKCLECGAFEDRHELQTRFLELNPGFSSRIARVAPDGDAELSDAEIEGFEVASCRECGGVLKPHVVFFGESVPRPRVDTAFSWVDEADALLVLGSSLTVLSGFRFVRHAAKHGKPVVIVNVGDTRGDELAEFRIEAHVGALLPRVVEALTGGRVTDDT